MEAQQWKNSVALHTPCDGCGRISYDAFYALDNGISRQIEVRAYGNALLCQPCCEEYRLVDDDGRRQMSMFEGDKH